MVASLEKKYISFSDQNFVCGSKFWSLENRLRCVPLALFASFLSLISRRESKETNHDFSAASRNNPGIRSHPLLYIDAESSFLQTIVPPNDSCDWSCAVSALSLLVLTSCDTRRLDSNPCRRHNFCTSKRIARESQEGCLSKFAKVIYNYLGKMHKRRTNKLSWFEKK